MTHIALIAADRQMVWAGVMSLGLVVKIGLSLLLIPLFAGWLDNAALGAAVSLLAIEGALTLGAVWLLPQGLLDRHLAVFFGKVVGAAAVAVLVAVACMPIGALVAAIAGGTALSDVCAPPEDVWTQRGFAVDRVAAWPALRSAESAPEEDPRCLREWLPPLFRRRDRSGTCSASCRGPAGGDWDKGSSGVSRNCVEMAQLGVDQDVAGLTIIIHLSSRSSAKLHSVRQSLHPLRRELTAEAYASFGPTRSPLGPTGQAPQVAPGRPSTPPAVVRSRHLSGGIPCFSIEPQAAIGGATGPAVGVLGRPH